MRKQKFKGRCEKRNLSKCKDTVRTYDSLQTFYALMLQSNDDIAEIRCNVVLEGVGDEPFTTDFVCTKLSGELIVRECVCRKQLDKPMTVRLLDISRDYWLNHGVTDWGLVIDAAKK